jgi:hypothetical protein
MFLFPTMFRRACANPGQPTAGPTLRIRDASPSAADSNCPRSRSAAGLARRSNASAPVARLKHSGARPRRRARRSGVGRRVRGTGGGGRFSMAWGGGRRNSARFRRSRAGSRRVSGHMRSSPGGVGGRGPEGGQPRLRSAGRPGNSRGWPVRGALLWPLGLAALMALGTTPSRESGPPVSPIDAGSRRRSRDTRSGGPGAAALRKAALVNPQRSQA